MYEILSDTRRWGWLNGQLVAYLLHIGKRCQFRFARHYESRRGTLDLRSATYIRHEKSRQYAIICFRDFVGHKVSYVMKEVVHDEDCRLVLKSQYRADHCQQEPHTKIKPYTYFERDPYDFQPWIHELRQTEKQYSKLYFRGSPHKNRGRIIAHLGDISESCDRYMSRTDYYRDCARARIGLALPGNGNICHREIEYFGMGVPAIMPVLKNSFHDPLIPNVHYIAVEANTTRERPAEVAEKIRAVYERYARDDDYLHHIAQNAIQWYDRNVWLPNSIPLTAKLLGIVP
jgi:hypothetical protein